MEKQNLKPIISSMIFMVLVLFFISWLPVNVQSEDNFNVQNGFIENQGQWSSEISFQANFENFSVIMCPSSVYSIQGNAFGRNVEDEARNIVVKSQFVNSNKDVKIVGEEILQGKFNYIRGNDPSKWVSGANSFQSIKYENLYQSIDFVYYESNGKLKYDAIIWPDGNTSDIIIRYPDATSMKVLESGTLQIELSELSVQESKPVAYQKLHGINIPVNVQYRLLSNNEFSFQVTSDLIPGLPLVIDPGLEFSSYFGGISEECASSVVVDDDGNIYITGTTRSVNFPRVNPIMDWIDCAGNSTRICWEVFVTKLDSTGTNIIFSTNISGSEDEAGTAIDIDNNRNVIVGGYSNSDDDNLSFPLVNAFDSTGSQWEWTAFLLKLDSSGSQLIYSTYIASDSTQGGRIVGIEVDDEGSAYAVGAERKASSSSVGGINFPLNNAIDTTYGGTSEGFLAKFDSLGNNFFCTYLGGSNEDDIRGISLIDQETIAVTGRTNSTDFYCSSTNFQKVAGDDIYFTIYDSSGQSISYSGIFGGTGSDLGYGIAADTNGHLYVIGSSASSDLPLLNAFDTTYGGGGFDVCVFTVDWANDSLVFSSYLGGSGEDLPTNIEFLSSDRVVLMGLTDSPYFPATPGFGGVQNRLFATEINPMNGSFKYSVWIGSVIDSTAFPYFGGGTVDVNGNIYLVGGTIGSTFPSKNAYQSSSAGSQDAVFAKFAVDCCNGIRGNANGDFVDQVNVTDLNFMIAFLFNQTYPTIPPPCSEEGDVNGDGNISISDITYLVDFLFYEGAAPPSCP